MENVTVYEYLLDKDKIIKVVHKAQTNGKRYVFNGGKTESTHKILRKEEMGVVEKNHVFSLEDNFEKYENAIICRMEERYDEVDSRQKKTRNIIDKLKLMCSSRKENHGVQGTSD